MLVLDADVLIDFLGPGRKHHNQAVEFVANHRTEPMGVPTPVLYELARHEARTEYGPTVDELLTALEWAEPLEFSVGAVRESARIDAELLDRGEPIPQFDVLVAGIARSIGGTVVARDGHYERIEGLATRTYT